MNGLLDEIIKQGIVNYGARYEESPSAQLSMKGKGYFGLLPTIEGNFATEISMTDDQGINFPSLVPTLSKDEVEYLLKGNDPTPEIIDKANIWANYRQSKGMNPFATPTELRMPVGLLGN